MKNKILAEKVIQNLPALLPDALMAGARGMRQVNREGQIDKHSIDFLLDTIKPGRGFTMLIRVKHADRLATIRLAAIQVKAFAKSTGAVPMIASTFLGERMRQALKEEGVGFLDLAGNFYLKRAGLYIEKIVSKNPYSKSHPLKSLFAPMSSRVTRALLLEPDRQWSTSELSKATGISIGQAHNTLDALNREELVTKSDHGKWHATNPTALLDAWAQVYPSRRRQRYLFFSGGRAYNVMLASTIIASAQSNASLPYAFGYASGLKLVDPEALESTKVQFYTLPFALEHWQQALELQEVESGGDVEIYIPYDYGNNTERLLSGVFYGQQLIARTRAQPSHTSMPITVVSNLQLYMDLLSYPGARKSAEKLRRNYLKY